MHHDSVALIRLRLSSELPNSAPHLSTKEGATILSRARFHRSSVGPAVSSLFGRSLLVRGQLEAARLEVLDTCDDLKLSSFHCRGNHW